MVRREARRVSTITAETSLRQAQMRNKSGMSEEQAPGQLFITLAFDSSPSQRAFLWLDFCHSGGIIPRDFGTEPDDREVISRALEVVQGQGKLIVAACTPGQKAYESAVVGHGLFTDALLRGLKGEAANKGEVTVNSLYDYIDRQMGGERQRPMMFGQMTERVVLMHYP